MGNDWFSGLWGEKREGLSDEEVYKEMQQITTDWRESDHGLTAYWLMQIARELKILNYNLKEKNDEKSGKDPEE